jgi:CspA family cold shock protein
MSELCSASRVVHLLDTRIMDVFSGRVSRWDDEHGWGVIESTVTPGGCWVHVFAVLAGSRPLRVGEGVAFTFETAEQDGYSFRAVEAWPKGAEPDRSHQVVSGPSEAHESRLTLRFDEPRGAG